MTETGSRKGKYILLCWTEINLLLSLIRKWVVSTTTRPPHPSVSFEPLAGQASIPVWTGTKTQVFDPRKPSHSESLYQLRYPGRTAYGTDFNVQNAILSLLGSWNSVWPYSCKNLFPEVLLHISTYVYVNKYLGLNKIFTLLCSVLARWAKRHVCSG